MGIIRDWLTGSTNALTFAASEVEAMDAEVLQGVNVPPEFYGLASYSGPTANSAPVTRKQAMSVSAIIRGHDLVPGTLGSLPLDVIGPDGQTVPWDLLDQPERDVPRSVTMTRTFADAWFHGVAWWRVTEFAWTTYPRWVERIDPTRVTRQGGKISIDGREVPADKLNELIRFDAPREGLLTAGARAIRTCINLDAAATRASDGSPPIDWFTPADGFDPGDDDDDIQQILDDWIAARRKRQTAYVPAALKYNRDGWSPKDLQMAEARDYAVLEIARLTGVDPEELGVSTTSRTYANQFDRRKAHLDFTLGGLRQAFEDRLSMNDVTPRGYAAKLNLSAFLRSDDKTRMETYEIGHRVGAYTDEEIRDLEDKPPLTPAQRAELPATRNTEEPAA